MQITRVIKSKKPLFEIQIDNGKNRIKTTIDVISALALSKGKEITPKDLKAIENETKIALAKLLAIKTVSKKQISEHELTETLIQTNINQNEQLKIKNRLKELGYINDFKFAKESYSLLLEKGKGPEFIDNYLAEKGIQSEIIKNVKNSVVLSDEQQVKQIKAIIKKKFKGSSNTTKYAFAKLLSFFLRKGFNEEIILKALKEVGITGEEDYADQASTY